MTVKEIVKRFLIDNDYDGLWTDDCGCFINDLFPCCAEGVENCRPGYKSMDSSGDWKIGPEKEREEHADNS